MGIISKDNQQIKLYYHSENSIGKQLLGFVKSAKKEVLVIDIAKTNVPGTQWKEIADMLDLSISELIDTSHPDFVNAYSDTVKMEAHDWMKVLDKYPQALCHPIVIVGEQAHRISTPSDFIQYIDPDSAGLEKPYNK
ncbi:MAG: hypothetical protein ABNH00_10585 [Dokdonia sp.]|jgi:arsenate reductase-like glutaredoxin family protein|nr:hypothetical protein [Cytophagaceae bacterium]